MMNSLDGMTHRDRLNEMAALVTDEQNNGKEMIKNLAPGAREALSKMQHLLGKVTGGILGHLGDVEDKHPFHGIHALDPVKAKKRSQAFSKIDEIMMPLMKHIDDSDRDFPELKLFSSKVAKVANLFDKENIEEMLRSPLKELQEYKTDFKTYTPEHQGQIEDFAEMMGFDDLLTVLRSPEL